MSAINVANTVYIAQVGQDIKYSLNQGASYSDITAWPLTINNTGGSTAKVLFKTDITITDGDQYFICGSSNIQFGDQSLNEDGTKPLITVSLSGGDTYLGLIRNGISGPAGVGVNGYNNIKIYNLSLQSNNSTLINGGGWFCWARFARGATGCFVVNCSVSAIIELDRTRIRFQDGGDFAEWLSEKMT